MARELAKHILPFVAAGFVALGLSLPVRADEQPSIGIDTGRLAGQVEDGVSVYKGIPYAQPPVGKLRWRAPQPATPWTGTRDASHYGPVCPQPPFATNAPQSEDCLTLNVWTPHASHADHTGPLPVMVWIHGGGSVAGSGRQPIYDGANLARKGVVVVTLNYRLGALGYFVHPALSTQTTDVAADHGMLANYGLMDQLAALRWVRRNIASFGGDPSNVTIFGESAGGCYVNMWMTSPLARDLFSRAITESCPGFIESRTMAEGAARGVALAQSLGVKGTGAKALAQLRQLPASDFISTAAIKGTYPFIDGVIVREDPFKALEKGDVADKPWLIGSNSFDASYLPHFGVDISDPLAAYDPAQRKRILEAYADVDGADAPANRGSLQFLSDMVMGASDRLFAEEATKAGLETWLYSFRYMASDADLSKAGVEHGGELPFVFGNPGEHRAMTDPSDREVSEAMGRIWTDFAKGKLPVSQSWSQAHATILISQDGKVTTPSDYHREKLDFALPFARDNAGRWDP